MVDKRMRSPDFPYVPLRDGVDLITKLHTVAKTSFVSVSDGITRMGVSPKSSLSQRVLSALLSYGLLDDKGTGKNKQIKVSDLGRRIILDSRPSEKLKAIREAVLNPSIMRKAWQEWGASLPSDESLIKSQLLVNWKFTDRAAARFAYVLKENFLYANLAEYIEILDEDAITDEEPFSNITNRDVATIVQGSKNLPVARKDFSVSLGDTKIILIAEKGKVTENVFDFLISGLRQLDIFEVKNDKEETKEDEPPL